MRPLSYWTKERCIESAKEFDQIRAWSRKYSGAYNAAVRNGWLEECTTHITRRAPNGYWTYERCLEDASKYSRVTDWHQNSATALNTAFMNGWYKECTAHMKKSAPQKIKEGLKHPPGYWNKERVLESIEDYTSLSSWAALYAGAYAAARERGWLEECKERIKVNYNSVYGKPALPKFKISRVPKNAPLINREKFASRYVPPVFKELPVVKPPTIPYKGLELVETEKIKGCQGCYFNLEDDCLTSGLVCSNGKKDIIYQKYEN